MPTQDRAQHLQQGAWHLYEFVKPEGGLEWYELSPEQRKGYRESFEIAAEVMSVLPEEPADEDICRGPAWLERLRGRAS